MFLVNFSHMRTAAFSYGSTAVLALYLLLTHRLVMCLQAICEFRGRSWHWHTMQSLSMSSVQPSTQSTAVQIATLDSVEGCTHDMFRL